MQGIFGCCLAFAIPANGGYLLNPASFWRLGKELRRLLASFCTVFRACPIRFFYPPH